MGALSMFYYHRNDETETRRLQVRRLDDDDRVPCLVPLHATVMISLRCLNAPIAFLLGSMNCHTAHLLGLSFGNVAGERDSTNVMAVQMWLQNRDCDS